MQFIDKLKTPGEHSLMLQGLAGSIEAILTVPDSIRGKEIAFLGHPHSLQGGTMNNKVVTTMARVFKELGIPALRFNFRGVGQSSGRYDDGIGESEDMLSLVRQWQEEQPQIEPIFVGFSFGSYVAYRTASQCEHLLLITIAPPIHHYNYTEFTPPNPWLIIQGTEDEVVPYAEVVQFAEKNSLPLIEFAETGHFFHGKLIELKDRLIEYISKQLQ